MRTVSCITPYSAEQRDAMMLMYTFKNKSSALILCIVSYSVKYLGLCSYDGLQTNLVLYFSEVGIDYKYVLGVKNQLFKFGFQERVSTILEFPSHKNILSLHPFSVQPFLPT